MVGRSIRSDGPIAGLSYNWLGDHSCVLRVYRRFPSTSVALVIAITVFLTAIVWHINIFHMPDIHILGIEADEVGEIGLAFLLVIPAFLLDRAVARQRRHEAQVQLERQLADAATRQLAAIVESSDDAIIGRTSTASSRAGTGARKRYSATRPPRWWGTPSCG